MPNFIDMLNQKFHSWLVIEQIRKENKIFWICQCDCGLKREVNGAALRNGTSKSCGCQKNKNGKNGEKHGMSNSPTYLSWQSMRKRCLDSTNISYKNYGGKGIKFCESWSNFSSFYEDLGERPDGMTLDRINPKGNYCKENCKWSTIIEQNNNKIKPSRNRPTQKNTYSREYNIYVGIRRRCRNFGYQYDDLLQNFSTFINHVGYSPTNKHTIDRIDNNNGYVLGNVRWATPKEQALNRRTTVFLTIDDETLCVADWARKIKVSVSSIRKRLKKGLAPREAVFWKKGL